MASRAAKPDGVFAVPPNRVAAFLGKHPLRAVPGIGKVTCEELEQRGIATVGELLAMPERMLRQALGLALLKVVRALKDGAPELEHEPLTPLRARRRSIGHSITFERDTLDPRELAATLWGLTEDSCRRLREHGLRAHHVTVTIRYSDFKTFTKGGFLDEPSDTDRPIHARALSLFELVHTRRLRVRHIGVRLSRFYQGGAQGGLFETEEELRERRLCSAVDMLRERYGRDSLYVGPGVMQLAGLSAYGGRGAALGSLRNKIQGEGSAS
jgi:DNA polymerase-4